MPTIEEVRKISPAVLLKLINRAKKYIKTTDVYKDMCREHNMDEDFIQLVPMKFGDLEVSARTERGIITLNYKLLCDNNFFNDYSYILHELDHFCLQCFGDKPTPGAHDGDYLHNPAEQSGFQRQLEYIDDQFGKDEANKYVEHLLDHHDKSGKDRNDLKETLMERVDGK